MSTFIEEIKSDLKNRMFMKLIFINVLIYVFIQLLNVVSRLTNIELNRITVLFFTLNTKIPDFLFYPWGIFTSIFSHFDFIHLLFNMIFLYHIGKLTEYYIGQKSIIYLYVLGGVIGGVLELIIHMIFPTFYLSNSLIVGASGSIMAIFTALAIYKPSTTLNILGIFNIKIIWLALFYFILDLIKIGSNDGIAHIAHIGGALTGYFLINNNSLILDKLINFNNKNKKKKFKVEKGGRPLNDDDFNLIKKQNEDQTNKILDKISRSGYESLTKVEKEFLFKQSKNG